MMYDRQGEEHYNSISALHKSIRANDDNAAIYWTTRMLHGGEDPRFIARRLIRAACEDIGNVFSNFRTSYSTRHYLFLQCNSIGRYITNTIKK